MASGNQPTEKFAVNPAGNEEKNPAAGPGPESALEARLAYALESLPRVGGNFLGFSLVAELGRGTFSRVFLARQAELGGRAVALKISVDLFHESQNLSQLQHTNIVPVFSIHHAGPLQALCMPYFGGTTLADVLQSLKKGALPQRGGELTALLQRTIVSADLRDPTCLPPDGTATAVPLGKLAKLSYVNLVLWMGARLAEALAHAHERGIIHRDIKPANILLRDDGQPMLLDFNLSENIQFRARAQLGGTFSYMAPEHLEALCGGTQVVDEGSDIYALGVVLFEMLTGRLPFPQAPGTLAEAVRQRLVHQHRVPEIRRWNRAVSPAVEAIIQHCLEPEPERRYQSMADLGEDLQRHLADLPLRHVPEPSLAERLRKWVRRHPRLVSPWPAAAMAAIVLTLAVLATSWFASLKQQADNTFRDFQAALPDTRKLEEKLILLQLQNGEDLPSAGGLAQDMRFCLKVLQPYQVLDREDWQTLPQVAWLGQEDRGKVRREIGRLLYWLAGAYRFQGVAADQGRSGLSEKARQEALRLNGLAAACFSQEQVPLGLLIQRAALQGEDGKVKRYLVQALSHPTNGPEDFLAAFEAAAAGKIMDALRLLAPDRFAPKDSEFLEGLGKRILLRAGRGERLKAYSETIVLLLLDPSPRRYYQAAQVFAVTSRFQPLDRPHAMKLLAFALRNGFGWERFQTDPYFLSPSIPLLVTGSAGLLAATGGAWPAVTLVGNHWPMSLCDEEEFRELTRVAPMLGRGVPPRMRLP